MKPEPESPKLKRKLPSPVNIQKPPQSDDSDSDEGIGSIFFAPSKKERPNSFMAKT